jgi:hypothetical protein
MPDAWNLFYSYSHTDAQLRDELATFLAPLRHQGRIVEWYDRKIEPGLRWENAINDKLLSADLILLLVSANFLASDYCFGVEMETAMQRMQNRDARVVPILLKPCLWKESRFSELQLLPRDAKPVTSWSSHEDAFADVANEISAITKDPPLASRKPAVRDSEQATTAALTLVRDQIIAYARLYERIRQQMPASVERTEKMEEVFQRMKALANAAFPLLSDFVGSQSPGEKLAAVSILECFGSPKYLGFLVGLIGSEKPFVGYHSARAIEFAVSATEPRYYPQLGQAIDDAIGALEAAIPGFDSDRKTVLTRARTTLKEAMETVTLPAQPPGP